jgi:hypothetical protein
MQDPVFQKRGGPRSVSGEPIEETMIVWSDGGKILATADRSGAETPNVRQATDWNGKKLRMTHWPGGDFTTWPHARSAAVVPVCLFGAQPCPPLKRLHLTGSWPPHPATQYDIEVASTTIRSTEVKETRRIRLSVRRAGGRLVTGRCAILASKAAARRKNLAGQDRKQPSPRRLGGLADRNVLIASNQGHFDSLEA